MNKKILCVLPFSFLVVACNQQALVTSQSCEKKTPDTHCTPNSGPNGPFVNVTPNSWLVVPSNVCVTEGDTLEIRIQGPTPEPGTVVTYPKKGFGNWVFGSNSSDEKKITLTVPPKPEDQDYTDYYIMSVGDGCIDPRITYN